MLDEETKKYVEEKLKELKDPIKLIFSEPDGECQYCNDITELYNEFKDLSKGKISIEKGSDKEEAPLTIIQGKEKRNIRYHGIPAGHEFSSFVQTLIDVSKGEPEISKELKENVKKIDFPVHFKVFVTPTCPYCPMAMKVANDFALLNSNIIADVYEVSEFREIGAKYNVMGVPKTVINETEELTGAYPPDIVLQKIMALKK